MKKSISIMGIGLLISGCNFTQTAPTSTVPVSVEAKVEAVKTITDDEKLAQYVDKLMTIVKAKNSPAMKKVILKEIVTVSSEIFKTLEERKGFATLIAIESKFNPKAGSSAGAQGLGQLIPKYAKEFGKPCGLSDVEPSDLQNITINLVLSACQYRTLIEKYNNDSMALVAYNAGAYSTQIDQLENLTNISNTETSSYVVKWMYVRQEADKK